MTTPPAPVSLGANAPISKLRLTMRAYNCLIRSGVRTVGQLVAMTEDDVTDIRNLGRVSLADIVGALATHGLKLKGGRR